VRWCTGRPIKARRNTALHGAGAGVCTRAQNGRAFRAADGVVVVYPSRTAALVGSGQVTHGLHGTYGVLSETLWISEVVRIHIHPTCVAHCKVTHSRLKLNTSRPGQLPHHAWWSKSQGGRQIKPCAHVAVEWLMQSMIWRPGSPSHVSVPLCARG
jgi:hypothetical protein